MRARAPRPPAPPPPGGRGGRARPPLARPPRPRESRGGVVRWRRERRSAMTARRVVIMGAAGRDFHDFNVVYRGDPETRVVAFTATQIPGIAGRRYPAALAGPRYPAGIPIVPAQELERLIHEEAADEVVVAYSDVPHETVMHAAPRALAGGADFRLLGPRAP